jgi:phosphoglucomutase
MELETKLWDAVETGDLLESSFENIQDWLKADFLPSWVKESIDELIQADAWEELNDRFYKDLAFGTGGMRGRTIGRQPTSQEMGEGLDPRNPVQAATGTNVLNDFTIIKATIGLYRYVSEYLRRNNSIDIPRFIIAHDVRFFSRHFCELSASTWNRLGGQALIFEGPRSTPQLSFSVRHYKAHCGAVITASHNPFHDNGFKVYFQDGAQVVSPHAESIVEKVSEVDLKSVVPHLDKDLEAVKILDESADALYIQCIEGVLSIEDNSEASDLKVVFSPIHGTGGIASIPVLKEMGVSVFEVPEQSLMDSAFPTVASPNPENASALEMAIQEANRVQADVVIATDPDADRMGVAVRTKEGAMQLLTGNQIGSLLAEYRIQTLKERSILPEEGTDKAVLIKTFVTTPMQDAIAKSHGLKVINTLTGFKWIGQKLANYEQIMRTEYRKAEGIEINYDATDSMTRAEILMDYSTYFVFGGEESYGYLAQDAVRDKDANASVALFCEMAAYYKSQNRSVIDALDSLYLKHGYYNEQMINLYYEGAAGAQKISNILNSYRSNPPEAFGEFKIATIKDFGVDTIYDSDGDLIPKQDFFVLEFENGFSYAVRGSGTEPKIKFYVFGFKATDGTSNLAQIKEHSNSEMAMLKDLIEEDAHQRSMNGI